MTQSSISIIVKGERKEVAADQTGVQLFADDKDIIAVDLNGQPRDLCTPLHEGDKVEPITLESDQGLAIMRHSATHVMAQAVQEIRPDAKLGIGPVIKDGFYYDFDVDKPFTPDDLKQIEQRMKRIIKSSQSFRRRVVTEEEARKEEADQPYKLELIGAKEAEINSEEATEVATGGELTMYDNLDREGNTVWKDLCRGPHLPNTRYIRCFKLMRTAAAYWRGDEKNPMLQRIYGTAWANKDDMKAYTARLEEAARRDHRKLGAEMDLFSFPDEIGPGLPVFHPKGAAVINAMEDYSRQMHRRNGYSFVQTPHITKGHLYEISGHLQWYKDGMYPPMHLDEEKDSNGKVTRQGFDYYLKPMNCPMHNLIFKSRQRSYKELPLRLFEFGTVYRYEKSGEVHGLTRVRGLTQDDSHIYCTREQMKGELTNLLQFVLKVLKDFGLNDFYLELSTKDPNKFVGSDEVWEEATNTLAEVAKDSGLELVDDPEGAAFYGPKISVQARDAIGRTWQVSTIQLDFNLPERFQLEYVAADGSHQRPVMIHRALFGSIERFFAILLEHYAGAFPVWLAPVQVQAVPVADEFAPHLEHLLDELRDDMVRCEIDRSDDRFGKKIRNAAKSKAPFILIAGEADVSKNAVSFRFRDGSQLNGVPVEQARAWINEAIKVRAQIISADDFRANTSCSQD
ncbi:threonine--tRNA ligase [Bifidobacterium asteroides]|uniref:threonine--tRNA ligase n=1 Tax=Bifidobacterium asteroides TaxID=1684 RepID=UPI0020C5B1B4|nr:threonine--tRNA ligase [Bifidobacterium asteroides]MCP8614433.1 threonine--tRNA ligase [Bifidobacterium asteroides]